MQKRRPGRQHKLSAFSLLHITFLVRPPTNCIQINRPEKITFLSIQALTLSYQLLLAGKQSLFQQQSAWLHESFIARKHGEFPSSIWIARIKSVFFIFPGLIPNSVAFPLTCFMFTTQPPFLKLCSVCLLSY